MRRGYLLAFRLLMKMLPKTDKDKFLAFTNLFLKFYTVYVRCL
jgi:hypothetical protein